MVNARPSVSSVAGGSAGRPAAGTGNGAGARCGPANASILEIGVENRHREIERPVAVLVVHEQHPDELLADIHLRPKSDFFGRPTTRIEWFAKVWRMKRSTFAISVLSTKTLS